MDSFNSPGQGGEGRKKKKSKPARSLGVALFFFFSFPFSSAHSIHSEFLCWCRRAALSVSTLRAEEPARSFLQQTVQRGQLIGGEGEQGLCDRGWGWAL